MRKIRKTMTTLVMVSAVALALSACSSGTPESPGAAPASGADVELLGGAEAAEALDELYQTALDAGQTAITIYGPGETDKQELYDELFSKRFPGISVTGVYLLGPDYASKMEAEFASGQHVADIVQAGDTSIAPNLAADYIEPFKPVTTAKVSADDFSDPDGAVWAASASTFGFMYNTDKLSAEEAPKGWKDLLDPSLKGQITTDNVTRNGAGFGTLSHIIWDGRFGDGYIEDLAAQDFTLQSSAPVAGSAVATGQFSVEPLYPMSFYLNDKAKGAPVEYVFPTEGGVHISPHYLGIVKDAPSPDAAKLLMTWLFTPEAQQAMSDLGYFPLVPGQVGPDGSSTIDDLDLFKPYNLHDLSGTFADNLKVVKAAFGD